MKRLLLVFIIVFPLAIYAQENISYNTKDGTIGFSISHKEYYIEFSKENSSVILQQIAKDSMVKLTDTTALLTIENLQHIDFETRKSALFRKFNGMLKKIEPVLIYRDGVRQVFTGNFTVKVTEGSQIKDILESNNKNIISIISDQFSENQDLVKLNNVTTQQAFTLINQLQESKNIEFIEPDFVRLLRPNTSDLYFSSQWAVKNLGYLGGTSGADMNVENAWSYATGQGIKVAVIDEGVDLSHSDLAANLLSGYDATGNGSNGAPNSVNNDGHGTSCAGIIAAVANNSIGVAGIAYNAKIIPVRIAYSNGQPLGSINRTWITSDSWIAGGITWAKNNGADILSNSWGGGSPSTTITNAINDAIINGRGGKGCIVLFSSGNNNTSIAYPSTLSNVIVVGASTMCDTRKTPLSCDGETWWGSNYGTGLDVIAPGVKIYTTDISGTSGYASGDYTSDFNGTSSACPNTAGVMALILSVNPNLNSQQARDILETTSDKVGGYIYQSNISGQPNGTWCSDAGYGRVNACAAVAKALATTLSITGPSQFCTTATYSAPNLPTGSTVTWAATGSISISGANNVNPVSVTKTTNGTGTLTANISTACGNFSVARSDIYAGIPTFPAYTSYPALRCADQPYEFVPVLPAGVVVTAITGLLEGVDQPLAETSPGRYLVPADVFRITMSLQNACGSVTVSKLISRASCGFRVAVYPNPANTSLTIVYDQEDNFAGNVNEVKSAIITPTVKDITLFNDKGNAVNSTTIKSGESKAVLDTRNIPNGTYYLHITEGKETIKKQIIIQH